MSDIASLGARLRSLVSRIEKLEEDKATIASEIRDVYQEAKSEGFDTRVLRQVVRMLKQDADERSEQETIKDLYLRALGYGGEESGS